MTSRALYAKGKNNISTARCPLPTLRGHRTNYLPQKACEKPDALRWDTAPAPTVKFPTVLSV